MPQAVIDTSVIVRYLTNDDPLKASAAQQLLKAAEPGSLLMPDVAVAELLFVLLRVYRWPAVSAADAVRAVVNHRALTVPGREVWLDVADDVERGSGPVDAYLQRTALQLGTADLYTFDSSMRAMPGVHIVSP